MQRAPGAFAAALRSARAARSLSRSAAGGRHGLFARDGIAAALTIGMFFGALGAVGRAILVPIGGRNDGRVRGAIPHLFHRLGGVMDREYAVVVSPCTLVLFGIGGQLWLDVDIPGA